MNSLNIIDTISNNLIKTYIYDDLVDGINNKNTNIANIKSQTMKKFIDNMYNSHINYINKKDDIIKEMFILHQISKGLYFYNTNYFKLSPYEFRSKVLFPNLTYILVRYMNNANKFIQYNARTTFNEIKHQSYGIIQRFTDYYYLDYDTIKTDAICEFISSGLRKFDPLTINNINYFYKTVFRNIYGFYFKKKHKFHTDYKSFWEMDDRLSSGNNAQWMSIYRDILYKIQIEQISSKSPSISQLTYNYNIFRNIIISNEFQNLFYSTKTDINVLNDNCYKLVKVYDEDEHDLVKKIKSVPLIYKLLKSVHISGSNENTFSPSILSESLVKNIVLEELITPFKKLISDNYIMFVLDNVATNFSKSILVGEYINLLTLSPIRINQLSFLSQLKQFIRICLEST